MSTLYSLATDGILLLAVAVALPPVASARTEPGVLAAGAQVSCISALILVQSWYTPERLALLPPLLVVQYLIFQRAYPLVRRHSRHLREPKQRRGGAAMFVAGSLVTLAFLTPWWARLPTPASSGGVLSSAALAIAFLGLQRLFGRVRLAGQAVGLMILANSVLLLTVSAPDAWSDLVVFGLFIQLGACLLMAATVTRQLDRDPSTPGREP